MWLDSKGWTKRASEGVFIPGHVQVLLREIELLRAALENARRDLFTIGPKKGSRSPLRKVIEEAGKRIEIAIGDASNAAGR